MKETATTTSRPSSPLTEIALGVAVASCLSLVSYDNLLLTFAVGIPLGSSVGWMLTRSTLQK